MKAVLVYLYFLMMTAYQETKLRYIKFPQERKIPERIKKPQHFAVLNNDKLQQLPDCFSICSSLHIEYHRDYLTFLVILTETNERWISVNLAQDLKTQSYTLWLETISRNVISNRNVDLRPWAWSYLCMGVDLVNRTVSLAMNKLKMSKITLNDPEFIQVKPKTLIGRLSFGDWLYPKSRVYQSESSITNVHVYSRLLREEEMVQFTSHEACAQSGDYLLWNEMKFQLHGDAKIEELRENVCGEQNNYGNIYLFQELFSWPSCMHFCQKIDQGRVPKITSKEDIKTLKALVKDISDASILDFWSSFSDKQIEGLWQDFYSPYNFTSSELFMKGQPNGGTWENCLSLWLNHEGLHEGLCDNGINAYKCLCSFHKRPILRLRGLCRKSNLDTFYTLIQGKTMAFYGLQQLSLIHI